MKKGKIKIAEIGKIYYIDGYVEDKGLLGVHKKYIGNGEVESNSSKHRNIWEITHIPSGFKFFDVLLIDLNFNQIKKLCTILAQEFEELWKTPQLENNKSLLLEYGGRVRKVIDEYTTLQKDIERRVRG